MVGLAPRRDTCGLRVGKSSLRAAGLQGFPPRTYRRACRPPNGLESIFDDLGPLYGGHILADSILILCYQVGRQSALSAHHPMLRVRTRKPKLIDSTRFVGV